MKKVIALLLCLLSVTLSLTGCSNHQEDFEEKQYMPREPIRAIYLDVRDRQIDVSASQDGQVHIAYAENSQEFYDISVSDDHVLTMTSGRFPYKSPTTFSTISPCPQPMKRLH